MRKFYFVYVLFAFLCNSGMAQFKDGNINYEVVSNIFKTAQVGSNNELTGDIVIPATVSDGENVYTVVGVKGWAFAQGDGAVSSISSIELPNTVETISNDAFANNTLLTSVKMGSGVTYIGVGAFYKAGLTSLDIPDSVTTIDNVAFFANTGLKDITFGSGLTSIGSESFAWCHPLENVYIHAANPPTINVNSFNGLTLGDINLNVPSDSSSSYSSASVWQDFNLGVLSVYSKQLKSVKLYPNPVQEKLHVQLRQNTSLNYLEVYSVNGQLMLKSDSKDIDVSLLENGQYLILIETDQGRFIQKVIKN